jgi:hypothetical protein
MASKPPRQKVVERQRVNTGLYSSHVVKRGALYSQKPIEARIAPKMQIKITPYIYDSSCL